MADPFPRAARLRVAAVALVNGEGRVLMQRRPAKAIDGDLWEFPGGKLEEGETARAAAIREIAEELGVRLSGADLHLVASELGDTPGATPRSLEITLFACRRWEGAPEAREASAIAWCDPHELAALPMPPLDYPLARALQKKLGRDAI